MNPIDKAIEAHSKMLETEKKCKANKKLKDDAAFVAWAKTHRKGIEEALQALQTIIDAREKATQGGWRYTDHNWHESSLYSGDKYLGTFDFECIEVNEENQHEYENQQTDDLEFITTAANITSKYIGG